MTADLGSYNEAAQYQLSFVFMARLLHTLLLRWLLSDYYLSCTHVIINIGHFNHA